jgi:hypothetical protein
LVIFENAAKSTFGGAERSVKHMHISLLSVLNNKRSTSFFLAPQRMPKFLDWKSVQLEHETNSRYAS